MRVCIRTWICSAESATRRPPSKMTASRAGSPSAGTPSRIRPANTPSLGIQLSRTLAQGMSLYGRAEALFTGAFEYDDLNTESQDAYSLANFRAGVRGRFVFVEGWIRNAFDTKYIPVAFAYGALAPSG